MRLDDLCASLPTVVEADHSIVDIVDVEHDSRRVGPGHLFACVPGQTTDGHDHASAAIEAALTSRGVEVRTEDALEYTNAALRKLVKTIRVGKSPHGIYFKTRAPLY